MFYLSGDCKFGTTCTYAHNYYLESEHYEEMRENAKKGPCPHLNLSTFVPKHACDFCPEEVADAICPYGEKCIYGFEKHLHDAGTVRSLE